MGEIGILPPKKNMIKDHLHVAMFPFSAFGHIIPYFQLSVALAKSKVHVSFISTPKNIERLPEFSPHLQSFLHLVPIPFPSSLDPDLLPEGAEATIDVPFGKMFNFMAAYDLLQHPIKHFIADQLPDWVISDFAAHWVADIAKEYDVPFVYFSAFSAASSVFFGSPENLLGTYRNQTLPSPASQTSPPKWVTFPSLVAFKEHEAIYVIQKFFGSENCSGIGIASRLAKIISASQALAIRTCNEVEGDYLEVYKKITGKPVIPTGLLPRLGAKKEITIDDGGVNNVFFEWLDKQKPRSVVFVGFGSECKLSKEQVFEIAHGLELSQLPFLWALRKPSWADADADALPLGFVERTTERGLLWMGWVPQMDILGHPSIGGSLFHSGWGSAIETLQFGHCLIVLPFMFDQPLNARLLVEKGLAVEVKRREDGSFSKDEIAKTLRQAMVEEKGEELRSNARKAAAVFGDEKLHQDHYIGAFVHYLKNNVRKRLS